MDKEVCYFDFFTQEGIVIKCLVAGLLKVFTEVNLILTPQGIMIQEAQVTGTPMSGHPAYVTMIFEAFLRRENFIRYEFPEVEGRPPILVLGVKVQNLKQELESVKVKSQLRMFVESSNPDRLQMEIFDVNGVKISSKFVAIVKHPISTYTPPRYDNNIICTAVSTADKFKAVANDLKKRSETLLEVTGRKTSVLVQIADSQIRGSKSEFGEIKNDENVVYREAVSTKKFCCISEMCIKSVTKKISIYAPEGLPLRLKCDSGLGPVNVYIQPEPNARPV